MTGRGRQEPTPTEAQASHLQTLAQLGNRARAAMADRNKHIRYCHERGHKLAAIARSVGLSPNQARRIAKRFDRHGQPRRGGP